MIYNLIYECNLYYITYLFSNDLKDNSLQENFYFGQHVVLISNLLPYIDVMRDAKSWWYRRLHCASSFYNPMYSFSLSICCNLPDSSHQGFTIFVKSTYFKNLFYSSYFNNFNMIKRFKFSLKISQKWNYIRHLILQADYNISDFLSLIFSLSINMYIKYFL